MTSEPRKPIEVHVKRLKPLLRQAKGAGIDVAALLDEVGLSPDIQERSDGALVSLADYYRLQNRLSYLLSDETSGLSARQLLPGSTDYVLRHVGTATNLRQAMEEIAQSYNLLHGGLFNRVEETPASVDYVIDDAGFPYAAQFDEDDVEFAAECVLVFLFCMLATIAPAQMAGAVVGVGLRRRSAPAEDGHLRFWSSPLTFGAGVYRLSIDRSRALRRIDAGAGATASADGVYRTILRAVETGSARPDIEGAAIAEVVRRAFDTGATEQGDVAAAVGISVAILRRRLQAEGESFRALRREVLNAKAKRLLTDGASVADAAARLGFAEFRSFNRAFKEWNGVTPKAWMSSRDDV